MKSKLIINKTNPHKKSLNSVNNSSAFERFKFAREINKIK